MNGRVYDPGLGRFLSADTIIQAPNNTQSYNRYSYVWNNPLRYTDPSGHVIFTLGAVAWAIAKGTVDWYIAAAVFGAAGFADSLMQGASLSDAFQSGLIAGAAAGAFSAIGASGMDFIAGSKEITQTLAFGTVGGITSSLQGGKFGHGFMSAGIGAAVGFSGLTKNMNMFEKALTSAVVGGTVSELTGGKFATGAATAAFASIVAEGAAAASRRNSFDPINPDVSVPNTETAEIALNVDAELIGSPYTVRGPGNVPAYSRSGIVEEVVVRAQSLNGCASGGCTVPSAYVTATINAQQFIAQQYDAINAQQSKILSPIGYVVGGRTLYQGGRVLIQNPAAREFIWEMGGNVLGEFLGMPSGSGAPTYSPTGTRLPPAIHEPVR